MDLENELQVLLFTPLKGDKQFFGVNIFKVQEILTLGRFTPLPNLKPEMLGLLESRGELLPLLDLSMILYNQKTDLKTNPMVIVCHANNVKIAIIVDSVSDIVHSTWKNVHDVDSISNGNSDFVNGILKHGEQMISLLNLEKLIMSYVKSDEEGSFDNEYENLKDKKVLIVDDSRWAQQVIAKSLVKEGIKCSLALNGKEAIDKIKTNNDGFNLILCDIEMPVMDGFSFLTEVKKEVSTKVPPIVMYSSLCDEVSINRALKSGARHYVTKYNIHKLVDSISKYAD